MVYPSVKKYRKKNVLHVGIDFNRNTEPDLVEKMEAVENRSGYVKGLVRRDIEQSKKDKK